MNLYLKLLCIVCFITFTSCKQENTQPIEPNKYEAYLQEAFDRNQFNGNVMVVENDSIVFQGAYGLSNINPIDSLQLNSIFRLGSVSKQFTAMAIMILKEKGKLSYDQDIREFIPELPYEGVSIRNLLNHTGGLPDYMWYMDSSWKPELDVEDPARFVSGNQDIINMLAEQKPPVNFEPGTRWDYSNTGYVLLASIVERASGVSFADFLASNIFKPLEMNDSKVYKYKIGPDPEMPNKVFGFQTDINGIDRHYVDAHYLNPIAGDGGVFSTLADLRKWDQALYTEKLVSKETLAEAFTAATLKDGAPAEEPYGFGWFIENGSNGEKFVAHSGGWVGFITYIHRELDSHNTIIMLSNNTSRYSIGIVRGLKALMHDEPAAFPKYSIREVLGKVIYNDGIANSKQLLDSLKTHHPDAYNFAESELNVLGYDLINSKKTTEAVEVFQWNAESYPDSPNVFDSLGDAYLAVGDTIAATASYEKALELDASFEASQRNLEALKKQE